MRVCLSALAAFLLATAVFAQEAGQASDAEAPAPAPAGSLSNADFLMPEFNATPEVSTLELNQDFQTFNWVENNPTSAKSFVFQLEAPAQLLVTDYKQAGDSFQVYDNGELIGSTAKTEGTNAYAETPEDAVSIAQFSKAAFAMAPGPHNITIEATSPYDSGSGAVRLVPATEEFMETQQLWEDEDKEDEHDEHDKHDKHRKHRKHRKDPVVHLTRTEFVEIKTTSTITTYVTEKPYARKHYDDQESNRGYEDAPANQNRGPEAAPANLNRGPEAAPANLNRGPEAAPVVPAANLNRGPEVAPVVATVGPKAGNLASPNNTPAAAPGVATTTPNAPVAPALRVAEKYGKNEGKWIKKKINKGEKVDML
ncbi:hypothetical protein VKS41_003418 [Umbelopsis sp. WA50703]